MGTQVTMSLTWENQDSFDEENVEQSFSATTTSDFDTPEEAIRDVCEQQALLDEILAATKDIVDDRFAVQLYISSATIGDQELSDSDYIDGDDETYELSSCRFYFPDGSDTELEFFVRD